MAAWSNAPDPASGPWTLHFSAGVGGPPLDGASPQAIALTGVDVEVADIAGPGDTVLEAGRITLSLVCSPPQSEAPPLTLTGMLHLDRISADCNDAQSRFGGAQADCALDAAGTLTVEGVDAEGTTRLHLTATFDLVQRLECPKKIATPTDHK